MQWCSSSRDVYQRANVVKELSHGRFGYTVAVYNRPWAPEGSTSYSGRVSITTRRWDVEIWLEYGP